MREKLAAMPRPGYVWVQTKFSGKNTLKPWERTETKAAVDRFVAAHYKANLKKPRKNSDFNYVVDVTTRWHGAYLYVTAKWACPSPNAISEFFDHDFVRLGVRFGGRWNLWARRHNDKWLCLGEEMLLNECLEQMKTDSWFQIY